MFYTIGLLLIFSIILLVFDRKSRYSYLFVLMAAGVIIAFFSIILHINMFASYASYYDSSIYYRLDYYIYRTITDRMALPIVYNIRLMNLGIALFLLAETIFNYEFYRGLRGYREQKKSRVKIRGHVLLFLIPFLSLLLYDPITSTNMYIYYHTSARPQLVYYVFEAVNLIVKLSVLYLLLRPVFLLLRYVAETTVLFLRKRIFLLSMGLLLVASLFYRFFYVGPFSVSVGKVIRSGFWIFENVQARISKVYLTSPSVVLIVLAVCMSILLSFRMDISATLFVERKIQKNLIVMNGMLGETLHSQKNLLFSLQILTGKIDAKVPQKEEVPEIGRMKLLIDESLARTTEMLDKLKEVKYHYLHNCIVSIIDEALAEVTVPENIRIEWDKTSFEGISGMYDRYHLCKALVNIFYNAVEAIEQSGKEEGKITVQIFFLFHWLVIAITDNGTGIKPRNRNRIFTPHYSGKQGKMNWGLGLPYVYKVVKAHLGQVKLDSREGVYTSVLVMLPVSKNDPAKQP
ncbi:ATP-binding protein [Lacrimispora indolis]|uniref:ATP-binding protein n=1 Tax=Lacrimispora indolis TaxID=69825 RepID=UPI000427A6FF|nr:MULTISPECIES: ATP-binding protein [Lachnospiraceae]MBE7721921.1 sensor histidine kinase [Lacrimispora celerecrescens]